MKKPKKIKRKEWSILVRSICNFNIADYELKELYKLGRSPIQAMDLLYKDRRDRGILIHEKPI